MNAFRDARAILVAGDVELAIGAWVHTPLMGACALTENDVAGSYVTDRNYLASLDPSVGGEPLILFDPRSRTDDPYGGLSDIYAGGGVVAGFCVGYWDNTAYTNRTGPMCPLAVDDSGAVCVQRVRGWGGLDVLVGNETIPLIEAVSGFGATFEDGVLVITMGREVYLWTLGTRVLMRWFTLPLWMAPKVSYSGGWFQGWHSEWGSMVVWQGSNLKDGRIVASGYGLHNPKIVRVDDTLHVLSCTGPGEISPAELERRIGTLPALTEWEACDLSAQPARPTYRPPTFAQTTQPLAILCVGEDRVDPDSPQFTSWEWRKWMSPVTVGVGCTVSPGHDSPETIRKSYGLAAELGLFNYPYWDGSGWNLSALPAEASPANTIPNVQCYLRVGEPLTAAVARWERDVVVVQQQYATVALEAMGNRGWRGDNPPTYAFTEDELARAWEATHDLALLKRVRLIQIFEWDRADGLASQACANLRASLPVWRAAVPDWTDCPKRASEEPMLILKRSRLSKPSVSFPGRTLCVMNDGDYLHVDPRTMGVYESGDDADTAAWITKDASGKTTVGYAKLEIEAYFITAKVDETA